MQLSTAKYIKTDTWHHIIDTLIAGYWEVTHEYDGMDAGIDYNAITLKKGEEEIKFEWDNWDEGSIKASMERLREIEKNFGQSFRIE